VSTFTAQSTAPAMLEVPIASICRCHRPATLDTSRRKLPGRSGGHLQTHRIPGSDEHSQGLGSVSAAHLERQQTEARIAAKDIPLPCDRAGGRAGHVVRCAHRFRQNWSVGATLAAPNAAGQTEDDAAMSVKHRLTIISPSERAPARSLSVAIDTDNPPQDHAGPDRTNRAARWF